MGQYTDYRVKKDGEVWVCDDEGQCRKATDREWLHLFQTAPQFTLQIARLQIQA